MWRRDASGERRSTAVERISLPDSINQCRRRYLTSVKCYPKRTQIHTSTMHICESGGRVFYRRPCSVFIRSLNSCVFLLLCRVFTHSSRGHLNISWRKSLIFPRTAAEQQKLVIPSERFFSSMPFSEPSVLLCVWCL